jgi:predicted SAM-dependent methyltransferase
MKYGLNCGSGQRPFKSTDECKWVNVDCVASWNPDIVCDGAEVSKHIDIQVDYFVLHHVLEHFGCGEASKLIEEASMVLKPGGSLLVFVPHMRALAEGYLRNRISPQIYMTNIYGAYMGHEEDRHKWGYDVELLSDFLIGPKWLWTETKLFNWRRIPGADIAEDWWILGMECIK